MRSEYFKAQNSSSIVSLVGVDDTQFANGDVLCIHATIVLYKEKKIDLGPTSVLACIATL